MTAFMHEGGIGRWLRCNDVKMVQLDRISSTFVMCVARVPASQWHGFLTVNSMFKCSGRYFFLGGGEGRKDS